MPARECTRCHRPITADRPLAKTRTWCRPCESERVKASKARRRERMGESAYLEHERLAVAAWRRENPDRQREIQRRQNEKRKPGGQGPGDVQQVR